MAPFLIMLNIFLFFSIFQVDAKVEHGLIELSSLNSESYISKFSFSPGAIGTMSISFKGMNKKFTKDGHQHDLIWSIFTENEWSQYLEAVKDGSLCKDRIKKAKLNKKFEINEEGDIEFQLHERFQPQDSSHYHYFLVSDCTLEFYDAHPPVLGYNLRILNNQSELPADEDGIIILHSINVCFLMGVSILCALGLLKQWKKFGMVHLSAITLFIALIFQILASFLELIHLMQYSKDGMGFRHRFNRLPLDFMSDTFQNLSEALMIILMISIGQGWTLIDELWSRKYDDNFSTFHDHDHWPGTILMLIRLSTCGLLIKNYHKTILQIDDGGSMNSFIKKFIFLSLIWLSIFPITVLFLIPTLPPYKRHFIVTFSCVLLQSFALTAMLVLFLGLGESGKTYLKNSTINSMGELGLSSSSSTLSSSLSSSTSVSSSSVSSSRGGLTSKLRRKVAID